MGEAGSPTVVYLWIALVVAVLWVIYLTKLIIDAHQGRTPVGRRRVSLRSRIIMWRAERRMRAREPMTMRPLGPPVEGGVAHPETSMLTQEATGSGALVFHDRNEGAPTAGRSDVSLHPSTETVVDDVTALDNGHRKTPQDAPKRPSAVEEPQDDDAVIFEAVELSRAPSSVSLPDRLEHRVLGQYRTCLKAILRVEAERQNYRRHGDRSQRWFYIRGPASAGPLWFVEGVDSQSPVVDLRDRRSPAVQSGYELADRV